MISKVFCVLALCAVLAAAAPTPAQQWAEWKSTHGKLYASQGEEATRFAIFTENLNVIAQLNNVSKTATFGANKFADLSRDEFRQYYLSTPFSPDLLDVPRTRMEPSSAPASFSWLDHSPPVVNPVKDQGQCGSCWAFSAVSNVESLWALAGNPLVSLSEQNLVDCDHECLQYNGQTACDAGCNGGLMPNAFTYMQKVGGIDTEKSYPYTAVGGQCQFNSQNIGASIKNWTMITNNEDELPGILVENGPLAIAADASEWQFYMGGVFDLPCGKSLNHGVVIEGYGMYKGIFSHGPYWLIRNSWGSRWGEKGYLRIKRGSDKCGLADFVTTAFIE